MSEPYRRHWRVKSGDDAPPGCTHRRRTKRCHVCEPSPFTLAMADASPAAPEHKLTDAEIEQRCLAAIVELLIANRHAGFEDQARAILARLKAIEEGKG